MNGSLAQALLALSAILAAARLLGGLAARLRQPRIGGEMLAGLLVGGALLSPWRRLGPAHHAALLNAPAVNFIGLLGQVGVMLYLLLVGLTLSPRELRRHGKRIAGVAVPVIVAAAAMAPVGVAVFAGARWRLAAGIAGGLVMAAALMVNGLPFVAQIVEERGLLRGRFGATALGASALLTVLPFVLVAMAQKKGSAALASLPSALLILVVVGLGVVVAVVWPSLGSRSPATAAGGATPLVLAVSAGLLAGWLSLELLGTGVLGAFLVGIALSRSPATRGALERALGSSVRALLVPVFLAGAGARLDPRALDAGVLEGAALFVVLLVAVSALAGAASARISHVGAGDARALTALSERHPLAH